MSTAFDAHVHLFASTEEGLLAQGGEAAVGYAGTFDELTAILDSGFVTRAAVYSTLPVEIWRRVFGRDWLPEEVEDRLMAMAVSQNRWLYETAQSDRRLVAVIGAEGALPKDAQLAHLEGMVGGSAGLKIHPALNYMFPDDPRYEPVYEFAQDAGLPVVAHGGGAAPDLYPSDTDYCSAERFSPVLAKYPGLTLIIAHFAYPGVDELIELAAAHPNLHTDLSYVLGAELLVGDPLAAAIRAFGVDRVLFGSDFPYHDPISSIDKLNACRLSDSERDQVTTGNAVRLFAPR